MVWARFCRALSMRFSINGLPDFPVAITDGTYVKGKRLAGAAAARAYAVS